MQLVPIGQPRQDGGSLMPVDGYARLTEADVLHADRNDCVKQENTTLLRPSAAQKVARRDDVTVCSTCFGTDEGAPDAADEDDGEA